MIHSSPTMDPERAKLKSRRDDLIIAQGQRGTSAALGWRVQDNLLFFLFPVWRATGAPNRKEKKEGWVRGRFTQGGAPLMRAWAGLALGYYQAAPAGAPQRHFQTDGRSVITVGANNCVQATPDCALLFIVAQVSGAPDAVRWATECA